MDYGLWTMVYGLYGLWTMNYGHVCERIFEVVVRQLTLVEGSRQIGPFYNFTSPILHFKID